MLLRLVAAGELQLLQSHDTLERGRLALQDERVSGFQHDIAGRLEAAFFSPQERDDLDFALAEIFERLHGDAGESSGIATSVV